MGRRPKNWTPPNATPGQADDSPAPVEMPLSDANEQAEATPTESAPDHQASESDAVPAHVARLAEREASASEEFKPTENAPPWFKRIFFKKPTMTRRELERRDVWVDRSISRGHLAPVATPPLPVQEQDQ